MVFGVPFSGPMANTMDSTGASYLGGVGLEGEVRGHQRPLDAVTMCKVPFGTYLGPENLYNNRERGEGGLLSVRLVCQSIGSLCPALRGKWPPIIDKSKSKSKGFEHARKEVVMIQGAHVLPGA